MNTARGSLAKLKTRLGELSVTTEQQQAKQPVQQALRTSAPVYLEAEEPLLSPRSQQADRDAKQALLESLDDFYKDKKADAVRLELARLTIQHTQTELDEAADAKTAILDVVGELLSQHIMKDYSKFVAGIDSVSAIEAELATLVALAQRGRKELASARLATEADLQVARSGLQKGRACQLLDVLQRLRSIGRLGHDLRDVLAHGDFAQAFWQCEQCNQWLAEQPDLRVCDGLRATASALRQETTQRLQAAMVQSCTSFQGPRFAQVLEGYLYLGNLQQLGAEIATAFTNALDETCLLQARAAMTHSQPGPQTPRSGSLQEAVKTLKHGSVAGVFAGVLGMVFTVLLSHHSMLVWVQSALAQHNASQPASQEARPPGEVQLMPAEPAQAPARLMRKSDGRAAMPRIGRPSGDTIKAVGSMLVQPEVLSAVEQEAEDQQAGERTWGALLEATSEGLRGGQLFLWNEAARKVEALLGCSAAFDGEPFAQVMQWLQAACAMGHAFCGPAGGSGSLHRLVMQHGAASFQRMHSGNLETLHSLLERELWRGVPLPPSQSSKSLASCMQGPNGSTSPMKIPPKGSEFAAWVAAGNPWAPEQMALAVTSSHAEPAEAANAGRQASPEGKGKGPATLCLSAVRLLRRMQEYGDLLRVLKPAPYVLQGLFEVFETHMVHTYATFADVPLAALLGEAPMPEQAAGGASDRLKVTLARICNTSLTSLRPQLLALQPNPRFCQGPPGAAQGGMMTTIRSSIVATADARGAFPRTSLIPPPSPSNGGPQESGRSFSAGGAGLPERSTAVDSLEAVAAELRAAKPAMLAFVPQAEHHIVEAFFSRTVQASGDVAEVLFRGAARLSLPLGPLAGRISGEDYDLQEPSDATSEWVDLLSGLLGGLQECLQAAASLPDRAVHQIWRHAIILTSEAMLEGLSKVKGRCTVVGRAQMSADLQEAVHALRAVAPVSRETTAALEALLFLNDGYIKAFYLSSMAELTSWAHAHPEYSNAHLLDLTACMADSKGLRKRERAAMLAQMEAAFNGQQTVQTARTSLS